MSKHHQFSNLPSTWCSRRSRWLSSTLPWNSSLTVRPTSVRYTDARFGSRTNDDVIVHLDLSSGWDFGGYGDFDWAMGNRLSPATITKQNPSFGASGSPGPQSGGQWLSPFSQFISFEIFDTRPGFQLMTNLPWFRLQSMLEHSGVVTPRFSSLFPDTNHGFENTTSYSYILC